MDYSSGKIRVDRTGPIHLTVCMGARTLGHINIEEKVFTCKREKYKCSNGGCADCNHKGNCHYFRLYEGFGFNVELISVLQRSGVDRIFIILKDFSAGWLEVRTLSLDSSHWIWNKEEVNKRVIKESKFEPQIVISEGDFKR